MKEFLKKNGVLAVVGIVVVVLVLWATGMLSGFVPGVATNTNDATTGTTVTAPASTTGTTKTEPTPSAETTTTVIPISPTEATSPGKESATTTGEGNISTTN